MLTATGTFSTRHASKYLTQMCKHFAHKIDVAYDDTKGHCTFPMGSATMLANSEQLCVEVKVSHTEDLIQVKHVIDVHLERFAFREDFKNMDWTV
ncbi:MAG: DUF2218 domain-containing protein [Shimia sp.]|nr:DUF2218 domain-containing protein [Shimia sp.]|mmetsp:Transcript_7768/g.13379  ORF Transcript_7768/g.13379 Transcript_7768/m.13379 type:complete len:95 (-) Transcript_7768:558-842(-)